MPDDEFVLVEEETSSFSMEEIARGLPGNNFWTSKGPAPISPSYTFLIENLEGPVGASPRPGDIVLHSFFRYTVYEVDPEAGTVWTGHVISLRGEAGPGVPTGGGVGAVLVKNGTADYATGWLYGLLSNLGTASDADLLCVPGVFATTSITQHLPTAAAGYLLFFGPQNGVSGIQIYAQTADVSVLYLRQRAGSSWTGWKSISMTAV